MAFFSANVDAALTNTLSDSYEDLAFTDHVAQAMATKIEKYGDAVKVVVKIGYGGGKGGTYSNADSNDTGTQRVSFLTVPAKLYGKETVDNSQAIFSEGGVDEGAIVNILTDAMESAARSAGDQLEEAIVGQTGYGDLATFASHTGSGPSYALQLGAGQSWALSKDDVLVSKALPASASLDTGSVIVTAVDQSTDIVTVTAQNSWTPTDGHVLGRQGTMQASTSPVSFIGIPGRIPKATARPQAGESFEGVDRTISAVLLAGHYLDGRPLPILSGINRLAGQIAQTPKAKPDVVLLHPINFAKCNDDLATKGRVDYGTFKGADIEIFFESIKVMGPKGPMHLMPAPRAPRDQVFVLTSNTWVLAAPGNKAIQPASMTGSPIDSSTADATIVRMRAAAFFYCTAPGFNGNLLVNP